MTHDGEVAEPHVEAVYRPSSVGNAAAEAIDTAPPLSQDGAFYGYLTCQFLGAFNDNLFKQLILLLAVPTAAAVAVATDAEAKPADLQGFATVLFGIPFVIFGGIAGWLADRISKTTVMVGAKAAEILIMGLGMAAFYMAPSWGMSGLWVVLFLMGTHSTFFGPGKYGILPEMLRSKDLAKANGLVQMTTFFAIIFGTALAGPLKDWLAPVQEAAASAKADLTGDLWKASLVCMGVAVFGWFASLMLRKTPPADSTVPLNADALGVPKVTRHLLRVDRPLLMALLASCAFWLIAGMTMQSVNSLGKTQLGLPDTYTSLMTSIISVGIAVGAVAAGYCSKGGADPRLATWGCWGVIACSVLLSITIPGYGHLLGFSGTMVMLVLLGASAAFFAIPVQVFIQSRPPAELKGRVIAFMNQANFLAIVLAGLMYMGVDWLLRVNDWPRSVAFAAAAIIFVPVAFIYRLPNPPAQAE
jgi:MFS family permease